MVAVPYIWGSSLSTNQTSFLWVWFVSAWLYFTWLGLVATHLCIFVSLYLCIFVSLYLCIFVSLYLCIFVSLYLCLINRRFILSKCWRGFLAKWSDVDIEWVEMSVACVPSEFRSDRLHHKLSIGFYWWPGQIWVVSWFRLRLGFVLINAKS